MCHAPENDLWLHVDAAYAGSALVCPEFRPLFAGIELADSFNFNPHKNLLVNFDCSTFWVKDRRALTRTFDMQAEYLPDAGSEVVMDYRHWQVPLGRRFRSLKLWFTMRIYGINGLQKHIREHVGYAAQFKTELLKDARFEVVYPVHLGLVCFRVKGANDVTQNLLKALNASGNSAFTPR